MNSNITPVQFYVLSALWDNDKIKIQAFIMNWIWMGQLLLEFWIGLEKRGFIERRAIQKIEDSVLASFLTDKSKEIGKEMIECPGP